MTDPNPATTAASVLTVMAHPDDAELWAGGTLARLAQVGTAVTIAVPEHADATRNTEATAAAHELGGTTSHTLRSTRTCCTTWLCPDSVATKGSHDESGQAK